MNNSGESNDNSFSPHHRGKGGNNKDDNSWTVKGGRGKNNNNNNNNQSLSNSNPNHVPPHLQSQGWKVKSDTNVKNPFASLEQEKPRKEVVSPPPSPPLPLSSPSLFPFPSSSSFPLSLFFLPTLL